MCLEHVAELKGGTLLWVKPFAKSLLDEMIAEGEQPFQMIKYNSVWTAVQGRDSKGKRQLYVAFSKVTPMFGRSTLFLCMIFHPNQVFAVY